VIRDGSDRHEKALAKAADPIPVYTGFDDFYDGLAREA
jgi:hypothetical protein